MNPSRPTGADSSERKDIDVIDIASPNDTHVRWNRCCPDRQNNSVRKAAGVETGAESKAIVEAAEKASVPNMVWYNYRRVPAVTLAKN